MSGKKQKAMRQVVRDDTLAGPVRATDEDGVTTWDIKLAGRTLGVAYGTKEEADQLAMELGIRYDCTGRTHVERSA